MKKLVRYVHDVVIPMKLSNSDSVELIIEFVYSNPDIHDLLKHALVFDFGFPPELVLNNSLGDIIRRYGVYDIKA